MAISRMQRSPLALLEWQLGAGAIDAQVKYLGQPAMHVAVEKLDFGYVLLLSSQSIFSTPHVTGSLGDHRDARHRLPFQRARTAGRSV